MQLLFLGWYSETIMAYPLFHPARPDHAEAGFPPPLVLTTEEFAQEFGEESAYLEFKEGLSAAVPQSVAAFSNTDGGVILIGVTDRGHVNLNPPFCWRVCWFVGWWGVLGRPGWVGCWFVGGFRRECGRVGGLVGWFGLVGVVWAWVFQGGVFTGVGGRGQQSWGKARRLSRMVW